MNKIVIDACVWNHWYNPSEDDLYSFEVINRFVDNTNDEVLCLDSDNIIADECSRNTGGDFYRIYTQCYERVVFFSSEMSEDVKHKLKDELGFHEATDLCYVDVALQADKVIITFDGDYGLFSIEYYRFVEDGLAKHRVAEYMSKELSLKVYLPQTYIKAC